MRAAYDYDRRVLAAELSPEEAKAVQHLTPAQRKDLSPKELALVARGILPSSSSPR